MREELNVEELFASKVFTLGKMKERLPKSTYKEVKKIMADVVSNVNSKIPNYKHIKNFAVRDKEFEKTTTQKIKRYGDNMKK